MADVPVGGGTGQIYGYQPPEISGYSSTINYDEIQQLESDKVRSYLFGVGVAILGFSTAQVAVASYLATTVSYVTNAKKTSYVLGGVVSAFGLADALNPGDSAMDVAQTERRYRFYITEYKHLVDPNSSKWDSWTDYANFAGFVQYYVSDLNTNETWLSHTEKFDR